MSWWDAIKIGADLWGMQATQKANKKANQQANAGLQQQQTALQGLQDTAQPGVTQQYNLIANQNRLTPLQTQGLDEARKSTLTAMGASNLRGSGRATTAAVKDVEGTLRNQYMDKNQGLANTAASSLSNNYFGAGVRSAAVYPEIAQNTSNSGLANNTVSGKAIGDIAAIIAAETRKKGSY